MIGYLIADEVKYVYFNCIVGYSYFSNSNGPFPSQISNPNLSIQKYR